MEPALANEPSPAAKKRIGVSIAAAMLALLAIPLRYYLGDDEFDERFSWRMFSAVRVIRCDATATETTGTGERPVRLDRVIHPAWIHNVERNRADVIEAFFARRCREDGVRAVRVVNECRGADDALLPPIEWSRDCASGAITRPDVEASP
jgi:hypothetical protein